MLPGLRVPVVHVNISKKNGEKYAEYDDKRTLEG